jgi:hypothetical protein
MRDKGEGDEDEATKKTIKFLVPEQQIEGRLPSADDDKGLLSIIDNFQVTPSL